MARDTIGAARGYTVIELIIAMSLATFVVVGVMMVTGTASRFAIVGNTRGDVTGWSLVALNQMNKELESATFMNLPTSATPGDVLSGCTNYSSGNVGTGATINVYDNTSQVVAFFYCKATVNGIQSLLRYETIYAAGAAPTCPMAAPTCGTTGGYSLVAKEFFHKDEVSGLPKFFSLAVVGSLGGDSPNAIEMHYVIGIATANYTAPAGSGLNTPTPQVLRFDTVIRTNIPLGSSDL